MPFVSSTYFRPSAERGRTFTVESIGTCPVFSSSLSVRIATVLPFDSVTGARFSTTPTRNPPARTSLPFTRFEPLSICTLYWRVGTKGRPLFAL